MHEDNKLGEGSICKESNQEDKSKTFPTLKSWRDSKDLITSLMFD